MHENTAPSILFVSVENTADSLKAVAAQYGGLVYTPTSLLETLGMYIDYAPNVIIIDTCAPYATEAYQHLRSVDASPIILLVDDALNERREHDLLHAPRNIPAQILFEKAQQRLLINWTSKRVHSAHFS